MCDVAVLLHVHVLLYLQLNSGIWIHTVLCCVVLCCRVCTWLSFDGGFTWSDIAEGTWIYEYADWGGLVVMSKHELNGPADEVGGRVVYIKGCSVGWGVGCRSWGTGALDLWTCCLGHAQGCTACSCTIFALLVASGRFM